jgi:hypothetical protein
MHKFAELVQQSIVFNLKLTDNIGLFCSSRDVAVYELVIESQSVYVFLPNNAIQIEVIIKEQMLIAYI